MKEWSLQNGLEPWLKQQSVMQVDVQCVLIVEEGEKCAK